MKTLKIVHLVDDTTAGGVMRMLDYLVHYPKIAKKADQCIRKVRRTSLSSGSIDADVIVSHLTISWRGLPALVALRAMNPTQRIIHVEYSYTRAFTAVNVLHKGRFYTLLRVAYSLFDSIVAVSQNQAEWLRERDLADGDKLSVIHPQVDLSNFSKLAQPSSKVRVIGAIGRLELQKGFDVLIEGFRLCPHQDARLLIFGDGSQRGKLEGLAAGDTRIEFRGHTDDLVKACEEVDMIAMPSRWEAFGLVAQEAKAANRPVILTSVDGLIDQHSDNTIVHDNSEPKSWAKLLSAFFDDRRFTKYPIEADRASSARHYFQSWLNLFGQSQEETVTGERARLMEQP